MRKIFSLALLALAFTACEQAPTPSPVAPISFAGRAPTRLNVAQINVVDTYRSSMNAPYVEHTVPTPPAMAVKQWAGQRLIAAGSQGTLEISIDDASIKETKLTQKDGLQGFFTDEQSERYDARLRVTMRLYDGVSTISVAEGNVDIARMQTVGEKETVSSREKILNGMVQNMLTNFDSEAEARLRQYFGRFIIG